MRVWVLVHTDVYAQWVRAGRPPDRINWGGSTLFCDGWAPPATGAPVVDRLMTGSSRFYVGYGEPGTMPCGYMKEANRWVLADLTVLVAGGAAPVPEPATRGIELED